MEPDPSFEIRLFKNLAHPKASLTPFFLRLYRRGWIYLRPYKRLLWPRLRRILGRNSGWCNSCRHSHAYSRRGLNRLLWPVISGQYLYPQPPVAKSYHQNARVQIWRDLRAPTTARPWQHGGRIYHRPRLYLEPSIFRPREWQGKLKPVRYSQKMLLYSRGFTSFYLQAWPLYNRVLYNTQIIYVFMDRSWPF